MGLLYEVKFEIIDNTKGFGSWYEKSYSLLNENEKPHYLIRLSDKHKYYGVYRFLAYEWKTIIQACDEKPIFIAKNFEPISEEEYYIFYYKQKFYVTELTMTEDEALAVLNDTKQRKNDKLSRELERIKAKSEFEENHRVSIPDDVQILVWNRDGGKCVKCGSSLNLEFDHIIPVSKGGSNTARNIQLLCERCNRFKGADIGG